jgi:glycosyltransferase involved in cell wall biosynthesis
MSTKQTHTFSVIICAYTEDRWHNLVQAVASVQNQTLPPQEVIIVVDYNPVLLERVRTHIPGVTVVANREAQGVAGARNTGIATARGMFVAFIDDDAIAEPDWLEQLAAGYTDEYVVSVGGFIEPIWRADQPAWLPYEFYWVFGCSYRGLPETATAMRNLIGCNMSVRRSVIATVGGFRIGRVGKLSIGREDDETEFCIRLGAAYPGAVILYQPAALVHHTVPPERERLGYFVRRCYSEGLSKAALSRLVGHDRGLAAERAYAMGTLPQGFFRGFADVLRRRDLTGLLRAGAIFVGLTVTTAGYLVGQIYQHAHYLKQEQQPTPETAADAQPGHPVSSSQ